MPLLRWFWSLRLRWRIPLGGAVLLVAVSALYLLVAWLHYRQCRHLDLLSLVPGRMPLVLRCRDAGGHWDRIRQTDLYRVLEAQVRRHGPLVAWAESASGRTWDELTAPLASGPAAALLTEARLRGLLGTDVIVALEPPAAGTALPGAAPLPRALLLTRIGFTEYLAWPLARRLARRSTEGAEADVAARGVGGHSVAGVGGDSVADVPRPSPAERAPTRVGGSSGVGGHSVADGSRVGGDFRLRPGESEGGSGGQAVADGPGPSPAERAPTRVGGGFRLRPGESEGSSGGQAAADIPLVLTGGDAELVRLLLGEGDVVPHLTLEGVARACENG